MWDAGDTEASTAAGRRADMVAGQRSRAFVASMDGVSGMEPVRGEVATNRFLATVVDI